MIQTDIPQHPLSETLTGLATNFKDLQTKRGSADPVISALEESFSTASRAAELLRTDDDLEDLRKYLEKIRQMVKESPEHDVRRFLAVFDDLLGALDAEGAAIRTKDGFPTWDAYLKAPQFDRTVWAKRHPQDFATLARLEMQR